SRPAAAQPIAGQGGGEHVRRAHQKVREPRGAAANAAMRPDQPRLLALGAELVEMRGPVGAAGGIGGAAAVPAADAGDGLLAVLVLVDDMAQGLRLTGPIGWAG